MNGPVGGHRPDQPRRRRSSCGERGRPGQHRRHQGDPDPAAGPGLTLNHHDQKKLDKYLKKHPEIAVPNTGAH